MSESSFDSNQLMMMLNILAVHTKILKNDAQTLPVQGLERNWKVLLSTLNDCFSYAQSHKVDLRDHKSELREIVENLVSVEKILQGRKEKKVTVVDDIAQGIIFIAEKIDNVLKGIGWPAVAKPITEAIYFIPKRITALFSGPEDDSMDYFTESAQKYLPPPLKALPVIVEPQPSEPTDDIVETEWVDIEQTQESFAGQVLRRMHERIRQQEMGDEEQ